MCIGLHVKCPLLLSDFNENLIFYTDFRKILEYEISKNPPLGAELFHADGRTDMAKLTIALRNFWNAPQDENILHCTSSTQVRGAKSAGRINCVRRRLVFAKFSLFLSSHHSGDYNFKVTPTILGHF
jgi:hypothetical protein